MKLASLPLASLLVLGSLSAPAGADTFSFGNLLSGEFEPLEEFATLDVNTVDNRTYSFTLTALDLDALFSPGAFIRNLAVDLVGSDNLPLGTLAGFGNGVSTLDASNGGGPGGNWEHRYTFGGGSRNRLTANESVSWISIYDSPVTFQDDKFALHVQGLGSGQGGSAWYTPIPEPETYALMLAGLGLLAACARRRTQVQAPGPFGFA